MTIKQYSRRIKCPHCSNVVDVAIPKIAATPAQCRNEVAATIERCAQVADAAETDGDGYSDCKAIAANIRALAK